MKCPYINPTIKQCENCPFPDCVNDEISYSEMLAIDRADNELKRDIPGRKKRKKSDRRYYLSHKKIILQKQKDNSDKHNEHCRDYYSRNAERERQRSKEKEIRNRDKRLVQKREYNRVYYLRKKAERQAG